MGPIQGPYILHLCMGPSYFWGGLDPPDPTLFRTLQHSEQRCTSISTRILGQDPTTFEAYGVHPISRPDRVLGRCGKRPYKAMGMTAHWMRMHCFMAWLHLYFVNIYLTSPRRQIVIMHQRRFPNQKYMEMRWRAR